MKLMMIAKSSPSVYPNSSYDEFVGPSSPKDESKSSTPSRKKSSVIAKPANNIILGGFPIARPASKVVKPATKVAKAAKPIKATKTTNVRAPLARLPGIIGRDTCEAVSVFNPIYPVGFRYTFDGSGLPRELL